MKEKSTHQDATDFEGPVKTGKAKRPADKTTGDKKADTTIAKIDPGTVFPAGKVSEQVSALFADVPGLSEDFVGKAVVVFEGAVSEKITELNDQLIEQYQAQLDEATQELEATLSEQIDQYMTYVTDQYMTENKVAIEAGIKNELSEQIIANMVDIVESNGIEIPTDKIDVVQGLTEEVADLEDRLNTAIQENLEVGIELEESKITNVFDSSTRDLTEGQKDKLKKLTENLTCSDSDEFATKLDILKESIVTPSKKDVDSVDLTEVSDVAVSTNEQPKKTLTAREQAYLNAARGE